VIAAIVPAAGRSERMGRPKLILPIDGVPLIRRVVLALREGGVTMIVVVTPPVDADETPRLVTEAERDGATIVSPRARPPDMRASFEAGLSILEQRTAPAAVLVVPGDSPGLTAATVARVIVEARSHPGQIVLPTSGGRRGHPLALPWNLARAVRTLPPGVGVNALLTLHKNFVLTLEIADRGVLADLDTPEDYQAWGPDKSR
jgi:molybdenum cofactor cytidylyltransferase